MNVEEHILNRLRVAGTIGLRCCLLESDEEIREVENNWILDDESCYYLTKDEENNTWLNWE